jgi:hypothetical protein
MVGCGVVGKVGGDEAIGCGNFPTPIAEAPEVAGVGAAGVGGDARRNIAGDGGWACAINCTSNSGVGVGVGRRGSRYAGINES